MQFTQRTSLLQVLTLCLTACGSGDVTALDQISEGGGPPGAQAGSGGTAGQAGGSAGQGTGGQPGTKPKGLTSFVVAGDTHSCALLVTGAVKCWGRNSEGQLGLGDTNARGDAPSEMGNSLPAVDLGAGVEVLEVAALGNRSCALLAGDQVKCWGSNPSHVFSSSFMLGDEPGEMGDSLPFVDLAPGVIATAMSMTSATGYAVTDQGQLEVWHNEWTPGNGVTSPFKLDLGSKVLVVQEAGCALLEGGSITCWTQGTDAQPISDLSTVDLGTGVVAVAVSARNTHRCAVVNDGRVKCWGKNSSAELGLGDFEDRDDPSKMGDALDFVDLGTGVTAVKMALGAHYSCALLSDGHVKCWGGGFEGQLGLGDKQTRGGQPGQMGDALGFVDLGSGLHAVDLVASTEHTCAVLDDGRVKCWGKNGAGQLGLGDTDDRGDEPGEMGDALPFVDLGGAVGL